VKTTSKDNILEDIFSEASYRFGLELLNVEPIKLGWLNLKWKIETNIGTFLIKQYNEERLKKYSIHELKSVFEQQNRLHHLGFPCPRILTDHEDSFFQSPGGEYFTIMEYCSGKNMEPGKLSEEQMYQLGIHIGKLHAILNDGSIPLKEKPVFIPPRKEERVAYWKNVHKGICSAGKLNLLPIIEKQLELMDQVDIKELRVDRVGWAHRDVWVDNILFNDNQLSAVLDFDRMKVDHLMLDVGRAVISGALDDNGLNVQKAMAFLDGYSIFQDTGNRFLKDSFFLLWYLESEWWLDSLMDERKGPPKRFVQEMVWLSEHLLELDDMLGGK
jgi:homoserine kinase type II